MNISCTKINFGRECENLKTLDTTFFFGAAIGSENAKNGKAKFKKPFLKYSDGTFGKLCPSPMILYSSTATNPAIAAVVVAIAGMIRPAICFV